MLAFTLKEGQGLPSSINIGVCFGEFKHEYEDITSAVFLKPKCYSVMYKNSEGQLTNDMKISGFNLESRISNSSLHHKTFESFCQTLEEDFIKIAQARRRKRNWEYNLQVGPQSLHICKQAKRLFMGEKLDTEPYGKR